MIFNRSRDEELLEERMCQEFKKTSSKGVSEDFPIYTSRQELTRYLTRYELFKMILPLKGSIVECGVYRGAGLMMFAKLSAIFEPYAFNRKIIGFDTFNGFPSVSDRDGEAFVGDLDDVNLVHLRSWIDIFDYNRPIGYMPKIELVKGDATKTIASYFSDHNETLVSLLYLDFDLFEPTVEALSVITARMSSGSVIAFDELNDSRRPGETIALLETLDIRQYKIQKFSHDPHTSFIVL